LKGLKTKNLYGFDPLIVELSTQPTDGCKPNLLSTFIVLL